jgi:hypothetical protein
MELGNNKHVFVINNAKVNANGQVVFYVSSKYIDPKSTNKVIKKLKKIPTTKKGEMFRHARFDIDDTSCPSYETEEQCDLNLAAISIGLDYENAIYGENLFS